jgi:predicted RNase H-like nuclease (RuvC/YqgF family)
MFIRIEKQNEVILQSMRTVTAMEEEGREIGTHLVANRKQIESVREKNTEMGSTMESSEQILKRMQNRDKCTLS